MQVGSYLAGLAIENSMLGAAHACANPLTKNYGSHSRPGPGSPAATRRKVERLP
jgi:alcohol dehydrogenase class IV